MAPQLGYLTTNRARAKVKQWFKQKDHEQNVASGRQLIERELHRLNIPNQDLQALTKRFGYNKLEDFPGCGGRWRSEYRAGRRSPAAARANGGTAPQADAGQG